METTEFENQILRQAIDAFENGTGLLMDAQEERFIDGCVIDAIIDLPHGAGTIAAEIKKWGQQANLGALINQINALPMNGMLVTDYVNPNMAQKLKDAEVPFMDTAGNAYINQPPLFVFITGKKANETLVKEGRNRAFDATGLKVVFGFLCNKELVNAPYREIAERTNVANGTVGWVINGLKEAGFIQNIGKKKGRRLTNIRKLLDRWVQTYPEKLRPKLTIGEFTAPDPYWWETTNINQYEAYWGGEIAAEKYTRYLKPEVATVYIPEKNAGKFIGAMRFRKAVDRGGRKRNVVRLYQPFWNTDVTLQQQKANADLHAVEPIIVYADLLATGDSRNLETARIIYDKYIAEHIRED